MVVGVWFGVEVNRRALLTVTSMLGVIMCGVTQSCFHQGRDLGQACRVCRQQAGLSGYQSGEEYENASGPLDTRERSFTGNPPVSSTGNTSPTQVRPAASS